jgi:hypothetical protein
VRRLLRTARTRSRLVVGVLPAVALVAVAKIAITEIGIEDIELNPLYTGLVAGNIFLIGFLLAGTLSDYKEAEKLPVELAASLESISDEMRIIHAAHDAPEARAALDHVGDTVATILRWLHDQERLDAVLERIAGLNEHFRRLGGLTEVAFVSRMKAEQNAARRMTLRIHSIRETSFVVAGFLVAAVTSALLVTVLLFIDVGELGTDLVLLCTLTFLLTYVLLLIRDLDNPFEHGLGRGGGSAEVSLDPLVGLNARLAA